MLEDDAADAELTKFALRKGGVHFSASRVETKEEYLKELKHRPPGLILSDYSLPGFNGHDALEIARQQCPETPFIFVTGTMGEEVAIETLKSGATDYVLKTRLSRLVPAVNRAIRETQQRIKHRHAEVQLRESHERLRQLSVYLQTVREEERTRIAREVHDELGQALTGCKLDLAWIAGKECAKLAGPFPARHVIEVQLHEFLRHRHGLFLVAQLEDRVAADHLLGLDERAVDDTELAVGDAHLGAQRQRHQPAGIDQAAGLDFAVGELAHRLHHFRRRRGSGLGRGDDRHESHAKSPF